MGKNHISGDTKYRKLIYVILIGFVVVWFIHTWELLPNDQTVLNCMLIILLLESQIQTGLIRSNSNYDQLFQKSTIAAQIIDNSDKAHYVSGSAINIDPELLKKAEDGFIQNGDMLFHRKPISGGYVLWQDNIRELRLILEKLQETREQLGETYELKKAEVDLKERRFHAEEKNRLYNRIAREVSPQLVTVDTFLAETIKHPEREKELLARVCVVSAYIKRLSNLILISEEKKEVSFGELESCLRESLDNIRLMGILTFLDFRCEDQILAEEAIGIYRLFENLIEQLLDKMNALIITLECQNRKMDLCIQVGCKANVGEIQMPEYSLQGIRLSYEIQEEDVVFHILLRGEAEADDELL